MKEILYKLSIGEIDYETAIKLADNFTKENMETAFNRGARNGSRAGMRVARGGELNMEYFDEWFSKNYE